MPWTVACQASLSMGFPRQEYWSGLPFHSPGDLSNAGIEHTSAALQADSLPLSHSWENSVPSCMYAQTFRPIYVCISFPHIFSSSGPGHLSPAKAQFRLVGLFESESHFVVGEPVRSPWVWLSWDCPWRRVCTYVCMYMCVCSSVVLLRTSSQLMWQEIEVFRVISKQ